jgi:hypothetical protein
MRDAVGLLDVFEFRDNDADEPAPLINRTGCAWGSGCIPVHPYSFPFPESRLYALTMPLGQGWLAFKSTAMIGYIVLISAGILT